VDDTQRRRDNRLSSAYPRIKQALPVIVSEAEPTPGALWNSLFDSSARQQSRNVAVSWQCGTPPCDLGKRDAEC
jgi:hypothetical protein